MIVINSTGIRRINNSIFQKDLSFSCIGAWMSDIQEADKYILDTLHIVLWLEYCIPGISDLNNFFELAYR